MQINQSKPVVRIKKRSAELTTSLHFFIVSLFPRLSTAFRALAEKLRDDNVSDKFDRLGHTLTIIKVFVLPPTERRIH